MPPISSIIDATNFLLLFWNSVHIELERFMETMPFCDGFPITSIPQYLPSVVATLTTWFLSSYQTISQRLNNLNYTESYSTLCDPINSFTIVINSICPVFVRYLYCICPAACSSRWIVILSKVESSTQALCNGISLFTITTYLAIIDCHWSNRGAIISVIIIHTHHHHPFVIWYVILVIIVPSSSSS